MFYNYRDLRTARIFKNIIEINIPFSMRALKHIPMCLNDICMINLTNTIELEILSFLGFIPLSRLDFQKMLITSMLRCS